MKKPDNAVFDLIRSLDKPEKRVVKAMLGSNGNKTYLLQLFRLFEKQERFDEQELKAQIRNTSLKKNFKVYKNMLYQAILRAQVYYETVYSKQDNLQYTLAVAELLHRKGLYDPAARMIKKAKAISSERADPLKKLECISWNEKQLFRNKDETAINRHYREAEEQVTLLQNELKYQEIMHEFRRLIHRHTYAFEPGVKKQFDQLLRKNGTNEDAALSPYAKFLFNKNRFYYYFYTWKLREAERYSIRQEELLHQYPGLYLSNLSLYIQLLKEKGIFILEQRKDVEQAKAFILQFDTFTEKHRNRINKEDYSSLMIFSLNVGGGIYAASGDFSGGICFLQERHQQLQKEGIKLPDTSLLTLKANLLVMNLMNGDYKRALHFANQVLNEVNTLVRKDIYYAVLLLNLICHFELNNEDYLPALFRSTYRSFLKKEKLFAYEKAILSFFRQLPVYKNSRKMFIRALQELLEQFEKLAAIPVERISFAYFDYNSWLKSKIYNKSIRSVIHERQQEL